MDKDRTAAIRRHHYFRLRKARRNNFGFDYLLERIVDADQFTEQDLARRFGMYVATPAPCSCTACGNPRKWFGLATQQERRHAQWHLEIDWETGDYLEHDHPRRLPKIRGGRY